MPASRVANGTKSKRLNRTAADKGNYGKKFGAPLQWAYLFITDTSGKHRQHEASSIVNNT